MRFQKTIISLGIFIAILPVLGVPLPWKEGLSAIVGLAIAILTILSNHTLRSLGVIFFSSTNDAGANEEERDPAEEDELDHPNDSLDHAPDPDHIANND